MNVGDNWSMGIMLAIIFAIIIAVLVAVYLSGLIKFPIGVSYD